MIIIHSGQASELTRQEALSLISDDEYAMQPLLLGEQVIVRIAPDGAKATDHEGKERELPGAIKEQTRRLAHAIDEEPVSLVELVGAIIDDKFHVYDLLTLEDTDFRDSTFAERACMYSNLLLSNKQNLNGAKEKAFDRLIAVEAHSDPHAKRAAFDRLENEGAAGVVFREAPDTFDPLPGGGAVRIFRFQGPNNG